MTDAHFTALFTTCYLLTGVWLITCWLLFRRLKKYHHERWVELGKPALFKFNFNTKPKQQFVEILQVLKFATGQQSDNFNDIDLSRIIWTMRIVFPTIHVLWVALFFGTLFRP